MSKFLLFWVWLDVQFFRLITLGNVRPGETMSACAWDMERKGKRMGKIMRPLIDWLFAWMQKDHCKQAFLWQMLFALRNPAPDLQTNTTIHFGVINGN